MQWRNTKSRYGTIAIMLHWLAAMVIYAMFALGLWMMSLGYYDIWYHKAPEIHKGIGVILFCAMIFRVIWRWVSPPPPALSEHTKMIRRISTSAHILLYLLVFSILVSGYLISTADGKPVNVFGLFELPALVNAGAWQADTAGRIHLWLAYALVALSVLHALAGLKHHFIDKDSTLKRMLGKSAN